MIHVCAYHFSQELWHRYATAQGVALDQSFTLELILTAFVFMVLASEINYRFVEQPLRRKGAEIANRRLQQFTDSRHVEHPSGASTAIETQEMDVRR